MKKVICLMLLCAIALNVFAARRALLIGNSAYSEKRLTNPVNDATDLAAKLRGLGFETTLHSNLDKEGFELAVDNFARGIGRNDEVVFFYAGHGVQIDGINYLIPVNTCIEDETQCKHRAVKADYIFDSLRPAVVSIVFLDACRNNPYSWRRSGVRGLAPVEVEFGSQYIIFSTSTNSEADDGSGLNSPFTAALIKHIDTPGLPIDDLIRNVGNELMRTTSTRQTPAVYGFLSERYYFAKAAPIQPDTYRPPVSSPPSTPEVQVIVNYGSILLTSNVAAEVYLDGERKGNIPANAEMRINSVTVGSHTIELRAQGKTEHRTVTVEKDKELKVAFNIDLSQADASVQRFTADLDRLLPVGRPVDRPASAVAAISQFQAQGVMVMRPPDPSVDPPEAQTEYQGIVTNVRDSLPQLVSQFQTDSETKPMQGTIEFTIYINENGIVSAVDIRPIAGEFYEGFVSNVRDIIMKWRFNVRGRRIYPFSMTFRK